MQCTTCTPSPVADLCPEHAATLVLEERSVAPDWTPAGSRERQLLLSGGGAAAAAEADGPAAAPDGAPPRMVALPEALWRKVRKGDLVWAHVHVTQAGVAPSGAAATAGVRGVTAPAGGWLACGLAPLHLCAMAMSCCCHSGLYFWPEALVGCWYPASGWVAR